jgi:hypothetical protein
VVLPVASIQDVALLAGTLLAAVAAAASWATVLQTTRLNRRSNQPWLRIQIIVSPATGCYGAVIVNAGEHVASGVSYVIADRATVMAAHLSHGFLQPGEAIEVLSFCAPVGSDDPVVVGFVTGRDRFSIPHDWTSDERHGIRVQRRWLRKRPVYSETIPRLATWFPDRPDPKTLTQVAPATQRKV